MFNLPKNVFRAMLLAFCTIATPALAATVVEFYNTNLDNYFITADANEAAQIDGGSAGPGWIHTGYTFNSGGSTPVCRFYGSQWPGPNSHFYTVDADECAGLQQLQASTPDTEKRWNFESLDFVSTPSTNGTCPAGTVPVYRAYNNGFARGVDSNHRITSSLTAIQEVVNRGWSNEGVVMCAPDGGGALVGVVDANPSVEAATINPEAFVVTVGSTSNRVGILSVAANTSTLAPASLTLVPWISQVPPSGNISRDSRDGNSFTNPYFSEDPYFFTNWNETANCGPAAFLMAAAYLKGYQLDNSNSEQQIKAAVNWFDDPVNNISYHPNNNYYYWGDAVGLSDIQKFAESNGLAGSILTDESKSMEGLRNELAKGRPVIVLTWYQSNSNVSNSMITPSDTTIHHYMLLVGMDDDYVYVNDPGKPSWLELPAAGANYGRNRKYEKDSFNTAWTKAGRQAISIYCKTCTAPFGIVTSSTHLGDAKVGSAYNATLSAMGGVPPYTWSFKLPGTTSFVSGGVLNGLNLNPDGSITGIPTTEANHTFTAGLSDSTGDFVDASIGLNVSATMSSPLNITATKQLPSAQIGIPYKFLLSASGGQGSYIWSKNSGVLPNGLVSMQDGSIVGIPSTGGEFNFSAQVSDSGIPQQTAAKGFLITVPCDLPQVMQSGQCVTLPPTCIAPQVFQNGQCVAPLPTCAAPQELLNGQCITPSLICAAPQVMQNGQCVTSVPIPATPIGTSPGSAANPGPTTTNSTVGLSWSPVSGATYYDLGVVDIALGALVMNTTTTGTSYTAALTAGTQYRWNVAACNAAGCSSYTTVQYFQTPAPTVAIPATPSSPSPGSTSSPGPTQSSSTVAISWGAVSGATYYGLGVRDVATGALVVDTTTTGTSYTAALTAGTQYRWNVAACNAAGCSSYTSVLYFQTPTPTCTLPQVLTNGVCVTPPTTPAAQVTIGPTSLNFGNIDVGTCGSATFAIQHVSGTSLASGTVSVSPQPAFSLLSGSSFSVSNGSAANITVKFCPSAAGTMTGTANVTSGATFTGSNTVTLTGTGITPVVTPTCTLPQVLTNGVCVTPTPAAQITVGPSSLNFGNVEVGKCGSAIFAIQHVSGTASAFGTVNVSQNPPFSI